ncbi:MAG: hypothetical protein HS104_09815 [Polyangiaceae bacterium]|nr:hypothetical protein [Polyangiaceae bacterium]MCL4754382.1 hypothetical protein [Myxococcales bacterium]
MASIIRTKLRRYTIVVDDESTPFLPSVRASIKGEDGFESSGHGDTAAEAIRKAREEIRYHEQNDK